MQWCGCAPVELTRCLFAAQDVQQLSYVDGTLLGYGYRSHSVQASMRAELLPHSICRSRRCHGIADFLMHVSCSALLSCTYMIGVSPMNS